MWLNITTIRAFFVSLFSEIKELLLFAPSRICYHGERMIEGTKQYRRSADGTIIPESSTTNIDAIELAAPMPDTANLANTPPALARREWFRSLVPSLGAGLVEFLRTSNHLQREVTSRLRRPDEGA